MIIPAIKALSGILNSVREFFCILQQFATLLKKLIFPIGEICLTDFLNLIAERFHATQLLTLVHAHTFDLPTKRSYIRIFLLIIRLQGLIIRKRIQKQKMIIFIKQGRRVMLTVNID